MTSAAALRETISLLQSTPSMSKSTAFTGAVAGLKVEVAPEEEEGAEAEQMVVRVQERQ